MKTLLLVVVAAFLCIQMLHAAPSSDGETIKTEEVDGGTKTTKTVTENGQTVTSTQWSGGSGESGQSFDFGSLGGNNGGSRTFKWSGGGSGGGSDQGIQWANGQTISGGTGGAANINWIGGAPGATINGGSPQAITWTSQSGGQTIGGGANGGSATTIIGGSPQVIKWTTTESGGQPISGGAIGGTHTTNWMGGGSVPVGTINGGSPQAITWTSQSGSQTIGGVAGGGSPTTIISGSPQVIKWTTTESGGQPIGGGSSTVVVTDGQTPSTQPGGGSQTITVTGGQTVVGPTVTTETVDGGTSIIKTTTTTDYSTINGGPVTGGNIINIDSDKKPEYNFQFNEPTKTVTYDEEILRKSEEIIRSRDNDCEKQRKKLNNDNDNLTRQLKSANKNIATLTEEKSWVLGELEICRDEYDSVSKDIVTVTEETVILKTKLRTITEEAGTYKTQLISANTEGLRYKNRADSYENEIKRITDINIKLTNSVTQNTNEITNLRTKINEYTIKINKCGADTDDWKRRYEIENGKVNKYEARIQELENNVNELRNRNTKVIHDLQACQSRNHDFDLQVKGLKDNIDVYKNQISNTEGDLKTCRNSLQKVTKEYNDDEIDDYNQKVISEKRKADLDQCLVRSKQLESDYQREKKNAFDCRNEFNAYEQTCSKNYKTYEERITQVNRDFDVKIDQCEANLKKERDNLNLIRVQITNLENRNIDINNKLQLQIKITKDWESKLQNCVNNSESLQRKIDTIEGNYNTVNTHLTTCNENSARLQNDLNSSIGKLNTCYSDLSDTNGKVQQRDTAIVRLEGQIKVIDNNYKSCQRDITSLRCDVNQFFAVIDDAQNKAVRGIIDVKGILDGGRQSLSQFVGGHNIECPTCGTNGPCITGNSS